MVYYNENTTLPMGQIYVKSYFPQGYAEWIDKTGLVEGTLTKESYDEWFTDPDYRKTIEQICAHYETEDIALRANMDNFLAERTEDQRSPNRIVYDTLVGKVFCDFWIGLIDQPIDLIGQFYAANVPKVEETFYRMEAECDLVNKFSAAETIAAYKYYTC